MQYVVVSNHSCLLADSPVTAEVARRKTMDIQADQAVLHMISLVLLLAVDDADSLVQDDHQQ
jgi:hypothetical protein